MNMLAFIDPNLDVMHIFAAIAVVAFAFSAFIIATRSQNRESSFLTAVGLVAVAIALCFAT